MQFRTLIDKAGLEVIPQKPPGILHQTIAFLVLLFGVTMFQTPARADSSEKNSDAKIVASAIEKPSSSIRLEPGESTKVKASWYGPGFEGRMTSNGDRFNSSRMTAASPHVPLGSHVVVTNLTNGKSTKVKVNDCGPHVPGRKLDVSKKAARALAMTHDGTAPVKVTVVDSPPDAPTCDEMKNASK
jgi:rare lipoprotein A (peptidoglycan hydrolase)